MRIFRLDSLNMEMFRKAETILNEFGGIKIKEKRCFSKQTINIDPTLALGEDDRFVYYSDILKTQLYPLGKTLGGYYFLAIAENGQIFWLLQGVFIMGNSFHEALSKMILGYHPEPIII